MNPNNLGHALEYLRYIRDQKKEALELELNPGGSIVDELQNVIDYSKESLNVFLNENQDSIRARLSEFEVFLREVSLEGMTVESTLKEVLEGSLRGTVIQQFKILKRKIGIDKKSLPKNVEQKKLALKKENEYISSKIKEDLNKTIKALLIEFYLALRICSRYNETPNYTRQFLGNLHKVNAGVLIRLMRTFKDTVIPMSYLKQAASTLRDPEGFVRNILSRFEELKVKYSQSHPYISDSLLLSVCRNKNPEETIEDYIQRIEAAQRQFPTIPTFYFTSLIRENPSDFERRVEQLSHNIQIIEDRYPFLNYKAKSVFGMKMITERLLIIEIERYISVCNELEKMYPLLSNFIKTKALFLTKEEVIIEINRFIIDRDIVIEDPRVEDYLKKPAILIDIYLTYGRESFLENCLAIQEIYTRLVAYFYDNDPVYRDIKDNFDRDFIRLQYISLNKSLDENIEFFRTKLELFKSLKKNFNDHEKYSKDPKKGYISYLTEAVYHTDPEAYLNSMGYETE